MWLPLRKDKLLEMIEVAESGMAPDCERFWDRIKIAPQKWSLPPQGDEGGGFWVVAIVGTTCIYYNDIEEGFNISSYRTFGQIDEYCCNQSELLPTISWFFDQFRREMQGDG